MIGPGLRPGALLNLDLVVLDETPVPRGMWGLGPELPRRVPLWGPLAWASAAVGGEVVGKALLVGLVVAASVGMYRLVIDEVTASSPMTAAGAAALYGLGPFLLTRLATGQLTVAWVMALLPWAAPTLLGRTSTRRVLCWSAALGLGGVFGGVVAGSLLLAGLAARRGAGAFRVAGAFLVGQLPWLAALATVAITTGADRITASAYFRPPLDGVGDAGRLLAGHGFWNRPFQIGGPSSAAAAVAGPLLLAAAAYGVRDLPAAWRRPLTTLALISLAFSASSSVWGLEKVVNAFTDTAIGAPLRETQRYLALYLVWLAPAAAAGVARAARSLGGAAASTLRAGPFALGCVLAGPALWGLGGQLDPVRLPPEWAAARSEVSARPGPLVALPWYQYFTLDVARDRLVLGVVPYFFGGDVLASSDPRLSLERRREVADPREPQMDAIAAAGREGAEISARLADLGVRWVVLQHEVDWMLYTGIPTDPGLERVVAGDTLDLYLVRAWRGPVVDGEGQVVASDAVVSPVWRVDGSGPATVAAPYQKGWLRGWSAASADPDGLIRLGSGSGLVWFWPSVVVVAADLVVVVALLHAVVSSRFRRAEDPPTGPGGPTSLDA